MGVFDRWFGAKKDDPDLLRVSKGVLARLAAVEILSESFVERLDAWKADARRAATLEQRFNAVSDRLERLLKDHEREVERIDAAIVQVRGQATGGRRRGARAAPEDDQAHQVGENLIAAISKAQQGQPDALNEILGELSQLMSAGSEGNSGAL